MTLESFLHQLYESPTTVEFNHTMALIDRLYSFTPTAFKNGEALNGVGENSGSCKLFAFAQLQGLSQEQTLACFGAYYWDDVLKHPEMIDHQNIRNFMAYGWAGVEFDGDALALI